MPIPNLKATSTLDVTRSEDANDSLDTIIKQAIGREPMLSFSRTGNNSVQLMQLLHALDPQGLSFGTPMRVQMQKCDKCSREFCSPINYRRHIRLHRRLKKLDKDSTKSRDILRAFWDKLSVEDAKEVVSFKKVELEEVPGSSIIKALTNLVRKPGFSILPESYLRAGSALLDIVQGRPRFPISSQDLFAVLDDASEKTFLCGTAVSMQRYIFDGEAGKIGLETKNLIACTSFLVEQKLVKAWLDDKDAEALRFQKLLVEEEEAAQKRKAELLERKRQKKLRQKEQKAKEQNHGEKADAKESDYEELEEMVADEACTPLVTDISQAAAPDLPNHVALSIVDHSNPDGKLDSEFQTGFDRGYVDSGNDLNGERQIVQGNGRRRRWQVSPKSRRGAPNNFHAAWNSQTSKLGVMQNRGTHKDHRTASTGYKVWSRKAKPEFDGDSAKPRVQEETLNESDQIKNRQVLIGSISVTLGNCSHEENCVSETCDAGSEEHQMPNNSVQDKPNKLESILSDTSRSTVKLWKPVNRHGTGTKVPNPVLNDSRESEDHAMTENVHSESPGLPAEIGNLEFSCHAAKAFLAQRWKEAMAADHVKLVLYSEAKGIENGNHESAFPSSKYNKPNILSDSENRHVNVEILESPAVGAAKANNLRKKPGKGAKVYIPKYRTPTK
ncbi:hypothetical protein UlMin_024545 [Ulmus minor]